MQPQRGREPGASKSQLLAHLSWLPAGALLGAHLAFTSFGNRTLGSALTLATLTVVGYFASAVLHAYVHRGTAVILGVPWKGVRIHPFGDIVDNKALQVADKRSAIPVCVAGPLASGVIGGLMLAWAGGGDDPVHEIAAATGIVNIGLAATSLLPGLPFDGGKLLVALGRPRLALASGRISALLMMGAGVWFLLGGPTFLEETAIGLWLVLGGIFVIVEARLPRAKIEAPKIAGELAGDWTRPFVGRLDADDPAPASGGPYAVSDNGRLAGVLPAGAFGADATSAVTVRELMVPWSADLGIKFDTPLERAIERLATGQRTLVVVDEKGVVKGVLDEGAIRNKLVAR